MSNYIVVENGHDIDIFKLHSGGRHYFPFLKMTEVSAPPSRLEEAQRVCELLNAAEKAHGETRTPS